MSHHTKNRLRTHRASVTSGARPDVVEDQHQRAARSHRSAGSTPNWLPVGVGLALAAIGVARRSWSGVLLALFGGTMTVAGARNEIDQNRRSVPDAERSVRVEKTITVNQPIDDVYRSWSDLPNLPLYASHLQAVTDEGGGRTRWTMVLPTGKTAEWDAEIMADCESNAISWRSIGEPMVPNVGAVHFQPAPGNRGTEILVRIEYNPPFGSLGSFVMKLFGLAPEQQAEDALRAFKELRETGERPTTDGQARGGPHPSRLDCGLEFGRRLLDAGGTVVGRR